MDSKEIENIFKNHFLNVLINSSKNKKALPLLQEIVNANEHK